MTISIILNVVLGLLTLTLYAMFRVARLNGQFFLEKWSEYEVKFIKVHAAWLDRLMPEELEYVQQMSRNKNKEVFELDLGNILKKFNFVNDDKVEFVFYAKNVDEAWVKLENEIGADQAIHYMLKKPKV